MTKRKKSISVVNRFIQDEKGIIRDTKTNLEWQVGPDRDTTWGNAKAWVDSLGNGWRLPTVEELHGLYEEGKGTRNIDLVFGMSGWWVWSVKKDSSSAWPFHFRRGYADSYLRSCSYYSRVFGVR